MTAQTRRTYPSHVQLAIDAAERKADTRPRASRIELRLAFPPSTNNLYRSFVDKAGRVRRAKSKAALEYEEAVMQTLWFWLNHHRRRAPSPPYTLTITAYPPDDKRRHDASNLVKAVEDSIMAAIKGDDDDVQELRVVKEAPVRKPYIVLVLEGEGDED